jgi:hypothetical protein
MGKNKKIKRRIEGLERSKEEHRKKIESYSGDNPYLIEYWKKEIAQRDEEIREERRKLED